ncbi:DUF1206 domain-containing protein [Hoyosella altamirensis]|uniref:DUF1206 domain-containing protein n=1 Tax=Hoyosella altamirensis TaxID=616997 RepID=A0A839RHC4_9ACTN|nr:DUF1206 domain-containing protein [Hoyosella altamirensis]MBB3035787.1 hypothetical protein [Hoyosella altamirensis]
MNSESRHPAQHSAFEVAARSGYVVSGLLHIAIGYLAIQLVIGGQESVDPDPAGAFAEIAREPGGRIGLWMATACFTAMALWRLVETVMGRAADGSPHTMSLFDRISALSVGAVQAALGYLAFRFASGQAPDDAEAVAFTGHLMQTGAGSLILVVAGLVVVFVGGAHVYKGGNRKFLGELVGRSGVPLMGLGMAGYVGKGLVIATVGVLVIIATFRSQPDEAAGLDAALRTLAAQPFGFVFLGLVALAMVTFGIFSLAQSGRAKM